MRRALGTSAMRVTQAPLLLIDDGLLSSTSLHCLEASCTQDPGSRIASHRIAGQPSFAPRADHLFHIIASAIRTNRSTSDVQSKRAQSDR